MARKKPTKFEAPDVCPICGQRVSRGALACPECGADHNSGWRQNAGAYDALDLPDNDFNYEEFIREEFGSAPKPAGVKTIWWIVAIVLIIVLMVIYFYAAH